jgi:long-chain fatty acid transport protein
LGSGFLLGISGARAQGMAGAWVAQGDDPSVLDHNPALLARFTAPELSLSLTGYLYEGSFEPERDPILGEGIEVRNEKPFTFIPHLYSAIPLMNSMVLGVGFYTPVNPSLYEFPTGSPGRYQVLRSSTTLVLGTTALAYDLSGWSLPLMASVALDLAYAQAEVSQALGLLPGFSFLDGTLKVKGDSSILPRFRAGFSYSPLSGFFLGLVYAQGFDIVLKGGLSADLPPLGVRGEDRIVATQRYPSELRLGIGYRRDRYRAELTLRGYRFSEYRAQTLDLEENSLAGIPAPDMEVPKNGRDTISVQIGAGYRLFEPSEVRVGYMLDPSALPPERISLSDFDSLKHLLALGYGITWESVTLDLALGVILYRSVVVRSSSPPPGALLGVSPPVQQGTYRRSDQFFSLGIGVRL